MKTDDAKSNIGLFDENRLSLRQKRACRINSEGADFLVARVGEDFAHRISAINRQFTRGADLFSFSGQLSSELGKLGNVAEISRYELPEIAGLLSNKSEVAIYPLSIAAFEHWKNDQVKNRIPNPARLQDWPCDLDLVVSAFGLHSCNDLPLVMTKIFQCMKSDGLLMMALPVNGTLAELRDCLTRAELDLSGGAAARIDLFIDLQQAGQLLQATGFKLPVIDREEVIVRYDDIYGLINDLRAMGMTSGLHSANSHPAHHDLFRRANELYQENYADSDGRIRASFCYANMTAWTPHESQQQPLKPGSADISLAAHLKTK